MIALIQRVSHASVLVDDKLIGQIEAGVLAFIGVQKDDEIAQADRLLQRILSYRVFPDRQGKMNLSVADIKGGLLLVPQFTLAADTKKGTRPGFSTAAAPQQARKLFEYFVSCAERLHDPVSTGRFAANMSVSLCNVGPVTFWLES